MAVTRVFGRVDGVEVILNKGEGDRWSVPVPFDTDGEYVVEIVAEDEAGNQSYMAKMLFVVNTALLCVHVVPLLHYASLMESFVSIEVVASNYTAELLVLGPHAHVTPPRYYTEIKEPVCAGGKEVTMQCVQFYAGEDRHVCLMVHATNNEPFVIRSARWELYCAGVQEAEGECMIDGNVIDAKIAPVKRATYRLDIIYQIADETLIERLEVSVK